MLPAPLLRAANSSLSLNAGSLQYVQVPASAVLTPAQITVEAWIESNTVDIVGGNNGTFPNGGSYTNGEVGTAFEFTGGCLATSGDFCLHQGKF
jgi:hypothetical protein